MNRHSVTNIVIKMITPWWVLGWANAKVMAAPVEMTAQAVVTSRRLRQAVARVLPARDRSTTKELLKRMQDGWNNFQAYLKTLSDDQMTKPVDDVGWTVKDHLVHLAACEDGIAALMSGNSGWERMNVDQATWDAGDFDKI